MRAPLLLALGCAGLMLAQGARAQTAAPAAPAAPVVKAPVKVKQVIKKVVKKKKLKKTLQSAAQQPTSATAPEPHLKFKKIWTPSATEGATKKKQIGIQGLVPASGQTFTAPARPSFKRTKYKRQKLESATAPESRASLAKRMRSIRFVRQNLRGQRFSRQSLIASGATRVHRARGTDYVVKPSVKRQERKTNVYYRSRQLVRQQFVPLPTNAEERED